MFHSLLYDSVLSLIVYIIFVYYSEKVSMLTEPIVVLSLSNWDGKDAAAGFKRPGNQRGKKQQLGDETGSGSGSESGRTGFDEYIKEHFHKEADWIL